MKRQRRKLAQRVISLFLAVLMFSASYTNVSVKAGYLGGGYTIVRTETVSGVATAVRGQAKADYVYEGIIPGEGREKPYSLGELYHQTLDTFGLLKDKSNRQIFDDVGGNIGGQIWDYARDKVGDKFADASRKAANRALELWRSAEGVRQQAKNLDLAMNAGRAGAKRPVSFLDSLRKTMGKEGDKWADKSVGLDRLSRAFQLYSIYKNAETVLDDWDKMMGDAVNDRPALKALEKALYALDGGVAAASGVLGVMAFIGCGVSAPILMTLAVGGVLLGIGSSLVGSEGFRDKMKDVHGGMLDTLDDFVGSLLPNQKTPSGVGAYKPNIYIYGAKGRKVKLRFGEPGLLVTTDPFYEEESGWVVVAEDDGMLTDGSGGEYRYLFYESVTEKGLFTTEEGFYIGADGRSEEFGRILSEYGFYQAEIDDFTEFWDEMLEKDADYIMYPQGTEAVDRAMPITITPTPDHLFRIWFAFEQYTGQSYQEAEPEAVNRDGYSVLEWGGMIF